MCIIFFLEFPKVHPFVIGIWCGISEPHINEYLQFFVSEMKLLMVNKFAVNEHQIQIKFGLVISDTPARSMIKGKTIVDDYRYDL